MNNSYYNVSHSRDYYKGKSVEFAGEWTSGVRYFNDEYLNSLVVYTEKDATGNIIHSALLACKKTHIAAYNNSIPDSTNNQPHLVINDNLGVIGIEPNDYWIFVSGSLIGTPGKSAEVVNTYLEAVALATENNISKIIFVKEEKSIYFIVGVGELRKIVSTSDFSELFESKVDKEPGKGLSTNDYSNSEKEKLKGIEENAQRNIIEEVDLNGVKVEPVNKVVSINVDTEVTENSNNLVTSNAVHKKLSTKQDTLIAGNGIKIENNKIDTTSITESETQPNTSIWVNPTENTEVELTYNRSQIDTLVGLKQDKLIAGNGIQIVDSTISSTVDTNPFIIVSQLPSVGENGKIYLTPAEKPENNNLADEWIWNNNSWERLGSASIDLSNYPKLIDLTDIINNEADNYITEARFNELKELLSTPNTIFYFNKDGIYYYSTSIDLSKISDTPSGSDYEAIENIAIYFPKKQDESGVYGYKLVLLSGFNAASYDFYWGINLNPINFSVGVYNGSRSGLVPAPAYTSTKKYLNVNGQWTTVKSSELDNDSGFITTSDLAKVAKTGKYSDLIDEPLIKSSQAPTNNEPLWVNPDEDPEEVEIYNRSQVDALLNTKQDTLIPGNGIIIEGNIISSTGGGESGGSIDLSPYAKKTDVETALAGKQDVISDLTNIREGAEKGKTALQSFTETDPVYTADKPSLALKSELTTKQDKLTAGNGISIKDNKIGVTAITESESQPITPLWVNPSEDAETNVTYNRSQIDALVGAKQDTLQLTVKDNGNIVLANIQGQSKEFMPATPSGDPMHYAYVAAGAEYNDTGADIIKTTPWADLADDDADKTVVHKAGYWYLNGLGDITTDEIRTIYAVSAHVLQAGNIEEAFSYEHDCRTYFAAKTTYRKGGFEPCSLKAVFSNSYAIVVNISGRAASSISYLLNEARAQYVIGTLVFMSETGVYRAFIANNLKYVRLLKLSVSVIFTSPYLYTKSILYMIQNEVATSAITITLHADAYARAMANADIVAALEAHPNVSLASA